MNPPSPTSHRRRCPPWLLVVLASIVAAIPAWALDWTTLSQASITAPFQTALDITFAFRNTGRKPVAIVEVETSCGCVEANADRKSYAPGESGLIAARVAIGDRFGDYERYVLVLTDESPTPVRLEIKLTVPEPATVSPRSVDWKRGEAAREKIIELRPAAGLEIAFTRAEVTSEDFRVQLETVQPGRSYRLHLTPQTTGRTANAAVRLYGRTPDGHEVLVSAYGNVQ